MWINKLKQITYKPDEQSEIIKYDFESLRGLPFMIQWLWLVHGMHLCGSLLGRSSSFHKNRVSPWAPFFQQYIKFINTLYFKYNFIPSDLKKLKCFSS